MKYDKKWPNAKEWEEFQTKGSFVIRAKKEYTCFVCGYPAQWIEGSFQCPMCSEECTESLWEGYHRHIQ